LVNFPFAGAVQQTPAGIFMPGRRLQLTGMEGITQQPVRWLPPLAALE
jgi:hypothetical protein